MVRKNYENQYKILKGPYQLSIDITNHCNLRCLHCYNRSGENNCVNDEMTDEQFINLVHQVADMKPYNVCFCGGEPMTRKQLLLKSIKILSDAQVKISMVSNGLLITREAVKELKKAGLGRIQISLDGLKESHDKLRNKEGAFDKAIQAIESLQAEGMYIGVAYTPTSWNNEIEFEGLYKLAIKYNIKELRVQATMKTGRGNDHRDEIIPSFVQYRRLIKKINQLKLSSETQKRGITIEWGDPIDHLIRMPQNECVPFVAIKANGSIAPSIYLPISAGNVKENSLGEIWNDGLGKVWKNEYLRELSKKMRSVEEMNTEDLGMPQTFVEKDIVLSIV